MSIISLLNEPNTYSPANVDASIMYRDYIDGKNEAYKEFIQRTISDSRREAAKDQVDIPTSEAEYCTIGKHVSDSRRSSNASLDNLSKPLSPNSSKYSNTSSNLYCYDEYDSEEEAEEAENESNGGVDAIENSEEVPSGSSCIVSVSKIQPGSEPKSEPADEQGDRPKIVQSGMDATME